MRQDCAWGRAGAGMGWKAISYFVTNITVIAIDYTVAIGYICLIKTGDTR